MTDTLLNWLNNEVNLSKTITSIQEDFRTGYLYAELLHKLGQIPSMKIFRNSNKDEDIIHNFCRLEKTFLDLNIVLTIKDRDKIIACKKETAMIYLLKIRQYLCSKLINLDTLRCKKSKELNDIYHSLQFKTKNNPEIGKSRPLIEKQLNPKDPYSKYRLKFKHLKMDDNDYKIMQQGEDDMKVFEEYHQEIQGLEKGRNNKRNETETKEKMNWKTSISEIRQHKKKLHEESMKELLYYRDASIQYLTQSSVDCANTIKIFDNNLSKLGLDIPGATQVNSSQNVSTDIILMRMKELMHQKGLAKKEKEKRARKRLKEESILMAAIDKKNSQLLKARTNKESSELPNCMKNPLALTERNTDATLSRKVHYNEILIGDRIGFFKTMIPDQNNLRYDLNDDSYLPSKRPFDKEAFIKSILHLDYETNLRESIGRQDKRNNHYPLMNNIIHSLIEITEESSNYQCNNKANLINDDQWRKWTEAFINGLPIVDEKEKTEEEESKGDTANYERDSAEITEREENEMFNYVYYLEDWNKMLIPNDIKGKQLKLLGIFEDLIRHKILSTVEDYEPTENEIDILTIPKNPCLNIPFGELIESIVDIKFPQRMSFEQVRNRFDYLPIKIALCGYPLSGHRSISKLINEAYPNIKVYNLTNTLNEYMETYERLTKPIEEHPKYKPNKKGLVEQLQQEVNKEREQFAAKEELIKPYIEAKANDPNVLPLDRVMVNLLINKLDEDFSISKSPTDSLAELYSKIAKKNEMIRKIEQLKEDEIATKKPKAKDIQLIQKDIDKLLPELYFGFITVDFPQTKRQCDLIEHYFTGFVSEIDKPLTEKNRVLNSFYYSIDSQPQLPSLTKLEKSGFDFVIDLSVTSDEIDRRFKGLRLDPNTKIYYHLEDNPPKESEKKVIERLTIPPEYANNKYEVLKEHYERNMNEIRNFYSIFGLSKYNTKTYQVVKAERKPNEIFEEINNKLLTEKIRQIEEDQKESEAEANQAEEKAKPSEEKGKQGEDNMSQILSSPNNGQSKAIQFLIPTIESPIVNSNIMDETPLESHYSHHDTDLKSDIRKSTQTFKEIASASVLNTFSSFNSQYLNECKVYFWFIDSQKKDIINYISEMQANFIEFLKMPSEKAELSSIYVEKFNSFIIEYGLYKTIQQVREEFTKDMQILNDKLWTLTQNKKADSIKYLDSLKQNHFKASQLGCLYEYTKQLLMMETKKYLTTIEILRQYYDTVHLTYSLLMCNPEDILEEINDIDDDFQTKVSKLYNNCIRLLYKQDERIKELEMKIRHSQAMNETNVSIRKKRKTTLLSNTVNLIDREFYFFEDEIKQILRTEKNKYKYRITMLKYFALNHNTLINKLFDDAFEHLDLWIILSIESQNSVLSELMFYLTDRLRKGESAQLDFEFDSFEIYKPLSAREYFYPNENALGDNDFAYNVTAFKELFEDVKQYTVAPQVISRKIFIDVLLKALLLKKKDDVVISKALESISYHSYASLMKFLEIAIDRATYDNDKEHEKKKESAQVIKIEEVEERKDEVKEEEVKKDEAIAEEIKEEEGGKDEISEGKNEEGKEIVPQLEIEEVKEKTIEKAQYETYLNLSHAFVILALINSKLIGEREEKELREELSGKVINSTQITRESFCQIDFWWETDEYLLIARGEEAEKEAKISLIKNMLFDICKDDNDEEDEINIEKFIDFLTFKNQNAKLREAFQSEYAKEADDRCTYLGLLMKP